MLIDKILFHIKNHIQSNDIYYEKYIEYNVVIVDIFVDGKSLLKFKLEDVYEMLLENGDHAFYYFIKKLKEYISEKQK
ncbi:MAG: hypothetical protein ACOCP4_00890 [Candidatus Woesearchaeota archaeon]